jgi:hypothetical protein
MYSILDDEWDITDITKVSIRKINFRDDPPQWTMASLLRRAWTFQPPSPDNTDVQTFMQEDSGRTPEERAQVPQNPDTTTLHTPWRDEIYYLWNHLFFDVGSFIANMYPVGYFKPPNHDAFGLEFPRVQGIEDSENVRVLTKAWETVVMVIPAYLAPSVSVRVETFSPEEKNGVKLRGRFTHGKPGEIWYMQKGLETRFYIEGDWDRASDGVAAVVVYGKMDEAAHESENGENEEVESTLDAN